jgi:regulator of protease activity HflC (stomatin/prohibitin superfamily)
MALIRGRFIMFGLAFKKAPPTVFVIQYAHGKVVRTGAGQSFWYLSPFSTIVDVPLSSTDVPFVFREITVDYQDVTIQGQLTYRIINPQKIAELLDFSVDAFGHYVSDPLPDELIAQRLVNETQVVARTIMQDMTLREVLTNSDRIVQQLFTTLRDSTSFTALGVELMTLTIASAKPTPEMARALEAAAREELQRQADQAIYMRRNAAVEEERRIKESELNTEIAVEAKRRQIRETKMAADIALEEQRAQLIDQQVENDRKDADSRAYALSATLKPLENADWRTLMAVAAKGSDPRLAIAMAFQELAQNAGKIGQLNVSPDLLQTLLKE